MAIARATRPATSQAVRQDYSTLVTARIIGLTHRYGFNPRRLNYLHTYNDLQLFVSFEPLFLA